MFLTIFEQIVNKYGIPLLFLEPEYLGKLSYWSYFIVGLSYERSIKRLNEYDDLTPNQPDFCWGEHINFLKGLCFKQMGDYENSIKEFNTLIEYEGEYVDVYGYVYRGISYMNLEQVFVPWSGKRAMFREFDLDTDTLKKKDSLHLKASIFIDINKYNDSIDVISSTILDPYESYFKLELDSIKNCFVNIYFDLMEIKRREMIDKINKTNKSPKKIQNIYSKTLQEIKDFEYEFFESTEGGHNQIAMRTYNQQVRIKLGIDNIEIFQVYKK